MFVIIAWHQKTFYGAFKFMLEAFVVWKRAEWQFSFFEGSFQKQCGGFQVMHSFTEVYETLCVLTGKGEQTPSVNPVAPLGSQTEE